MRVSTEFCPIPFSVRAEDIQTVIAPHIGGRPSHNGKPDRKLYHQIKVFLRYRTDPIHIIYGQHSDENLKPDTIGSRQMASDYETLSASLTWPTS